MMTAIASGFFILFASARPFAFSLRSSSRFAIASRASVFRFNSACSSFFFFLAFLRSPPSSFVFCLLVSYFSLLQLTSGEETEDGKVHNLPIGIPLVAFIIVCAASNIRPWTSSIVPLASTTIHVLLVLFVFIS